MMNIQELAETAVTVLDIVRTSNDPAKEGEPSWYINPTFRNQHGLEVIEGWFNLYSVTTGQSAFVVYHMESGMVFKTVNSYRESPTDMSKRMLGLIMINDVEYPVRLPEYGFIEVDGMAVQYQEYVAGEPCDCDYNRCEHSDALVHVTGCEDTHRGNWKITPDGEVILFDFEGLVPPNNAIRDKGWTMTVVDNAIDEALGF